MSWKILELKTKPLGIELLGREAQRIEPEKLEYYEYSCAICKVRMLAPKDGTEQRVWCCGAWKTPPKETFFNKLQREDLRQRLSTSRDAT